LASRAARRYSCDWRWRVERERRGLLDEGERCEALVRVERADVRSS
jgi:hypothetical protein